MNKALAMPAAELDCSCWESTHDISGFTVNSDLAGLIAAGNYDYVDPGITAEVFRTISGSGPVATAIDLLHLNRYYRNMSKVTGRLEAINEWLFRTRAGYQYRFVYLIELLILGAAYPDLQRKLDIAALGTLGFRRNAGNPRSGTQEYVLLNGNRKSRGLDIGETHHSFYYERRLAVVRVPLRTRAQIIR